jgi:salicylate hydroxylase
MFPPAPKRIIIAGAGIAGLTTALALASRGLPAKIFERSPSIDEVGAGIQLSPNATRILQSLGALPTLLPLASKPDAVVIRDGRSLRQLASVALGSFAEARWGAPYLTVHRADLQAGLLTQVRERPEIELTTGATVRGATFEPSGITVSIERGGKLEEERCDLAVGADGVGSALRACLARPPAIHYSGSIAWRATLPGGAIPGLIPGDSVTTFVNPAFHLVAYPVRGGASINLVAVTKGPPTAEGWAPEADVGLRRSAMRSAAEPLAALLEEAGPWSAWPLHVVDAEGDWTHLGGLALIGDAAHAMTPYAAQGAAMAIEDAETLAAVVAQKPEDLAAAFGQYEALRRKRVRQVARRGAFNHLAWHAAGPVALARNLVLSLRPPERLAADLDWIYGWDPETRCG